jgi:hypothetical protein
MKDGIVSMDDHVGSTSGQPRPRRTLRKPSEQYYTAAQAKAKLGVNDSTLYAYVERGELQRIVPRGKKHGLYLRSEVDQLARDIDAFFVSRRKTSGVFARATKVDIPACAEISHAIFTAGGYVHFELANAETRASWMDTNPDIFYVVKDEGQVMGYTAIVPLPREIIEKVLREEVHMKDITPNDILPFVPGVAIDLYLMTMAVRPSLNLSEKRAYGARLISGLTAAFIELGRKGIVVRDIYSRTNTPDGIRLLKKIGFSRIPSVTTMQNYVIHIQESGIPAAMQYKEALEAALKGQ